MFIDRGMGKEDVVHIYNGILLSHKKNEIMPFAATWMDLESVILREVSQTEKEKYYMTSLICIIFFLIFLLEDNCFTILCWFLFDDGFLTNVR